MGVWSTLGARCDGLLAPGATTSVNAGLHPPQETPDYAALHPGYACGPSPLRHLDADRDGGAGDDGGIVVLGVGNIETAFDGLDGDIADRK